MNLFKSLFSRDSFRQKANEAMDQAYQNGVLKAQRAVIEYCNDRDIALDWVAINRRLSRIEKESPRPKL
jgi:hypothetical protein